MKKIKLERTVDELGNPGFWSFGEYPEGNKNLTAYFCIKEHAKSLVDACWISLESLTLSEHFLTLLSVDNIPEELRLTEEIFSLGELSTYPRSTIAGINGIGESKLSKLDKILKDHGLDWEVSMDAIRTLAKDI